MTYQEFEELFKRKYKEPVIVMSPTMWELYSKLLEEEAKRFVEVQESLKGKHFTRRFRYKK